LFSLRTACLSIPCLITLLIQSSIAETASAEERSGGSPATGTLAGRITYEGKSPTYPVANDIGRREFLFLVSNENAGLRWAVVYLTARKNSPRPLLDTAPDDSEGATVDQYDFAFEPHVVAVRSGAEIAFTNSDAANHNVRADSDETSNTFNIVTPVDGAYTKRFRVTPPGKPLRLVCDIHAWMRGWVYVFDHPFYAITDEDGAFAIGGIPPGEYDVHVQQPDGELNATARIDIRPNAPSTISAIFSPKHLKSRNILRLGAPEFVD
jgi:plastocyanin